MADNKKAVCGGFLVGDGLEFEGKTLYATNTGGTEDYTELENKPSINSVELNGNKTLEDLGIASKEAVTTLEEAVDDIVDDIENVDTTLQQHSDKIAANSSRIDTFTHLPEGSTTGDAELADIRVGYDGKTYSSAGSAVREQVSGLKQDLTHMMRELVNCFNKVAWTDENAQRYIQALMDSIRYEEQDDGGEDTPGEDTPGGGETPTEDNLFSGHSDFRYSTSADVAKGLGNIANGLILSDDDINLTGGTKYYAYAPFNGTTYGLSLYSKNEDGSYTLQNVTVTKKNKFTSNEIGELGNYVQKSYQIDGTTYYLYEMSFTPDETITARIAFNIKAVASPEMQPYYYLFTTQKNPFRDSM